MATQEETTTTTVEVTTTTSAPPEESTTTTVEDVTTTIEAPTTTAPVVVDSCSWEQAGIAEVVPTACPSEVQHRDAVLLGVALCVFLLAAIFVMGWRRA